jgi:hypothetical protein
VPDSAEHEKGTPSTEDVLAGPVPEDPRRGPRTSFHRKRDFIAVVLIVVVAVAVGVLVATSSDIAATTSQTAWASIDTPETPNTLPPVFGEAWRMPSAATPVPVVAGATVVTGNGNEVIGREPLTGQERWRYARDIPLCTVSAAWSEAIAVYRKTETSLPRGDRYHDGNCSEVTSLKAASGERDHQRNGDAELGTRLLSDGVHVTATGKRLINTWRSDMVLTMQYGTVPDMVNPDKQPRTGCTYGSIAVTPGRIGVIERCAAKTDPTVDSNDRLSVYKPTAKESDSPTVDFSVPLSTVGTRLIALTETYAAVAMPNPARIAVYDTTGNRTAEYPLTVPASDLAGDLPSEAVSTSSATGAVYWFTGSHTIALSSTDLHPLWTVENTLGPGSVFAGYLLLPVKDALAVIDQATGARVASAPVNREDYSGPIEMSTVGPIVLEQRGPILVALR